VESQSRSNLRVPASVQSDVDAYAYAYAYVYVWPYYTATVALEQTTTTTTAAASPRGVSTPAGCCQEGCSPSLKRKATVEDS
jgi:hypothetical protein